MMPTSVCRLHALSSRPTASMMQALSNEKVDEAPRLFPPPPRLCGPWEGGLQRKERRGFGIIPPADSPTDTHSPTDTPPTQTTANHGTQPLPAPHPPGALTAPAPGPRPGSALQAMQSASILAPHQPPGPAVITESAGSGPAVTSVRSFQLDDLTPHKRGPRRWDVVQGPGRGLSLPLDRG